MLAHGECTHTDGIRKEKLGEPSMLGATSDSLWKSVRNFMSSFWVFFRHAAAKQMVEDHRVEELQKKAAKGVARSWTSQTATPPPPKAPSSGPALTLEAGKTSMTTQVPVEEPAVEKEPTRAPPVDAQKDGGAVTQMKDKTPSPSPLILRCR